jgi:hypothetical protein
MATGWRWRGTIGGVLAVASVAASGGAWAQDVAALPDAPRNLLFGEAQQQAPVPQRLQMDGPLCPLQGNGAPPADVPMACQEPEERVQPIISRKDTGPLNSKEKGELAVKDVIDPFNLLAVAGYAGFSVALNAHSAYGPGFKGWGKLTGYSFVEDAQGEFFGTFLIPSLVREDPRYRRMPGRPFGRRLLHAVAHTVISEHDDGRPMPNYATLLTYPISAELSNLYVPGVQTDSRSTGLRVVVGLASDPVGNIVAEFLPDIARHVHIHALFFQEILNQVATGGSAPNVM